MAANYCGTGLDEYVPPGDPTLGSSILSARSVWPGIEVSWTYPNINPEGVAHTLLYRSTASNFASAIQIAIVEGGYYFDQDPVVDNTKYYYWIKMISVNGTVGPAIGPASAIKNNAVDYVVDELTGQINNSHLNDELNASIDQISDNTSGLSDLKQEQLFGDAVLSAMWDDLRTALDENENAIFEVRTESIEQDEVLLQTINGMTAGIDGDLAEYGELIQVLVDNDAAQSAKIETLTASMSTTNDPNGPVINVTAAIATEEAARVYADGENNKDIVAVAARVTTLEANTDPDNPDSDYASLQQQMIATTKTANDAAEAAGDASEEAGEASEEAQAAAAAAAAAKAAQEATQDEVTQNKKDAQDALTGLSKDFDEDLTEVTEDLGDLRDETYALYTLRLDVNGLVSGFGMYNNGFESSFIVHADTFAVGIPNRGAEEDNVYPFIIGQVNGKNVIALNAKTLIPDAHITTASIADANITTAKILDANITSAKIQNAAVDTLKIGGDSVTVPAGESANVSIAVGNAWTYLDADWNDMYRWAGDGNANGPKNYPTGLVICAQVSYSGNAGPGDNGGEDGWDIDWNPGNGPFPFITSEEDLAVSPYATGSAPGTIGVKVEIQWFTNQNTWVATSLSDLTRSWSSCALNFGGSAVSTTFIEPPYWSRGIRCRILGYNRPSSGYPGSGTTREATKYGYFIMGSKR